MPSFRRKTSATDTDRDDKVVPAEQAEAEAAEAEAVAAAARARAKAIRLREEAQAAEQAAQADADEDEADSTVEGPTPVPSRRGGRALVVRIVAMTLAVLCTGALIAVSAYMVTQHRRVLDQEKLNSEYVAAGRQSVVTLMSLDFNNAEEDVKRIIENSTGSFKTDFEDQAEDFVKVAQDSKVVTDVTVTAAAVEKMNKDSATVLVAATSRVTNAAGAKQEPRAWRLSVDLQRDGGQIKMAKVEFVP